ncbi:MAG TPA: hypothetical protein VG367_02470 [Mucilaginibacter sp.]|jgi:hypothetical protein|nr:hypothetical protein [Mucilaginibacter sp.]
MNPKSLFKNLFFVLITVAAFQSCRKPAKPGTYQNDQIAADQRKDFHTLNDQMMEGLKANKPRDLEGLMSKEMLEDNSRLRTIELISNRLKEGDYSVLDEFYIVHKPTDTGVQKLNVTNKGLNNYTYTYENNGQEQYIVFFTPKSIPNQYLVTAEFCKLNYGWKLIKLDVGQYTINGKTAPELFKVAKDRYDNKCLAMATAIAEQAGKCINPALTWQYPDVKAMDDFSTKAIEETNRKYQFPYTVAQVNTQPWIFRIFSKKTPQGYFPEIYYISHLKLADTVALKNENANVQKVIAKVIPGIDKDNKLIYYSAFKNMPDGSGTFDHFDMIQKLN